MNRVIKFRGLNAQGDFVYGLPSADAVNSTNYYNEFSVRICWLPDKGGYSNQPIKNGTLGQFTGLTDVNGVEIYEGDIVCRLFGSGGQTKRDKAAAVKFSEFEISVQGAILDVQTIGFNINGEPLATDGRYEVVGNIYEKPELYINK